MFYSTDSSSLVGPVKLTNKFVVTLFIFIFTLICQGKFYLIYNSSLSLFKYTLYTDIIILQSSLVCLDKFVYYINELKTS